MSLKKFDEFELPNSNVILTGLNEAKAWPVETIVMINENIDLGQKHPRWINYQPEQFQGASGGVLIMKVVHSGQSWIEGTPLYYNMCNHIGAEEYRGGKANLSAPKELLTILEKSTEEHTKKFGKKFYMDGNEPAILDAEGKNITVDEGEYTFKGNNFTLTLEKGEEMAFMYKNDKNFFSIPLSKVGEHGKEMSSEHKSSSGDFFGKQLKTKVTFEEGDEHGEGSFKMETWTVQCESPVKFEAGPFLSKEDANKCLISLKELKFTVFNKENTKVVQTTTAVSTMEKMVKLAKQNGLKVDLPAAKTPKAEK